MNDEMIFKEPEINESKNIQHEPVVYTYTYIFILIHKLGKTTATML